MGSTPDVGGLANAKALADGLMERGFHLVSGGTDNHLLLVDLRPSHDELTGKEAEAALEASGITVNKNTVPGETRSPFVTSGLRIGTPAIIVLMEAVDEERGVQFVEGVDVGDLAPGLRHVAGDHPTHAA